ncbi:hypothetical protein [Geitlerinema sp. P-1104]|nr:hypothetical protein [Geitlerinema sp. P-1104]
MANDIWTIILNCFGCNDGIGDRNEDNQRIGFSWFIGDRPPYGTQLL